MLPDERQSHILRRLSAQEFLSVEAGARALRASPATVRRDFARLAERGLAERTRGGVRRLQAQDSGLLPFAFRAVRYSEEKAALARAAAALLKPGDVVMIDGGTSTHHLAACLPDLPLIIITNSLRLAASLSEVEERLHPPEIHVTGGALQADSGLLAGPQTVASLAQFHAQWALLSVSGIGLDGIYNTNALVVESERVMMAHADQVVVLADHSKLGAHALCRIAPLDAVDRLVTDVHDGAEALLAQMAQQGLQVDVVPIA